MNKKRAKGVFQFFRCVLASNSFSLHPLLFVHPAALLIAGYLMVSRPFPLVVKVAVFLFICLAASWLMYRLVMQPPSHSPASDYRENSSQSQQKKIVLNKSYPEDQFLINQMVA